MLPPTRVRVLLLIQGVASHMERGLLPVTLGEGLQLLSHAAFLRGRGPDLTPEVPWEYWPIGVGGLGEFG